MLTALASLTSRVLRLCAFFLTALISLNVFGSEQNDLRLTIFESDLETLQIERAYTGVLRHRNVVEIISPVEGIITSSFIEIGDIVYDEGDLFLLRRTSPGFPDLRIRNHYKGMLVINRFAEVGNFVDQNEIMANLARPHLYQLEFGVLAREVVELKQAKRGYIELESSGLEPTNVPQGSISFHSPLSGEVMVTARISIDCRVADCPPGDISGWIAKYTVEIDSKNVVRVPTKSLSSEAKSAIVLDSLNRVAFIPVRLVASRGRYSYVKAVGLQDRRLVIDFNRVPLVGEEPSTILTTFEL